MDVEAIISGLGELDRTDDGQNWAPQQRVPNVGTSEGPSLAVFNNRLFMAWKGVQNDPGIYWSSADRFWDWAPQKKVEGVGTSEGAVLAFFAPVASRTPSLNPNDGMEVTQAIQDMNQSVELIAEKKTVVRMYLENAQLADLIQPVQGELAVRRLPDGPT